MSECIIVGGGIIGLLSARELLMRGLRVRIVERGEPGSESSWAGGGILSTLYPWRYAEAVTRLARWSQQEYPAVCERLRQDTGIDPEWTQSGLLMLDTAELPEAQAWAAAHDAELQLLAGEAITSCEPALGTPPARALWMPAIAQLRNPRMLQALRKDVELRGAIIQSHCEVLDFASRDGHIVGVHTAQGLLPADRVILAGGAWSAQLLKTQGISIEVAPVRGQMLLFQAQPGLINRIVLNQGRYLIPRRDGHILIGSTVEYTGFDKTTTEQARNDLLHSALSMVPALAQASVVKHWAGLRPGAPEGIPYIGELPALRGLFVNAGHFRNGVVTGLASARLLADLISGTAPMIDPTPYRPELRNASQAVQAWI